jgi:pyruvate/2-oxoglutarate dehydrogenase complex dihydrolipoamide dehydrogenase (E3) component
VTVIEFGPRLISREDEDVSQAVAGFLKEEGIDVRVDSKMIGVEKQEKSITAKIESMGKISQIAGTHMLVATGRRPNTDDLGLDKAGTVTDARGYILVDDQLRTSISGIWAMGDCNGRGAFTHTSWNDFEIVAANLLDNDQRRVSDRITAYALYTDPPLGRAGMTEAEVRKTGKSALISTTAMKDVMRAYERGETKGFMKILVDRDNKQILGASFLGLAGDEVIHCVLDIMYAKAPYTVMAGASRISRPATGLRALPITVAPKAQNGFFDAFEPMEICTIFYRATVTSLNCHQPRRPNIVRVAYRLCNWSVKASIPDALRVRQPTELTKKRAYLLAA